MRPNKKRLTDLAIERLRPPTRGQELHWDTLQPGLALFVSYGGTKTFRSTFVINGKFQTRALGRYGDISLTEAREQARADREDAVRGIDPRRPKPRELKLFGDVVAEFIEHYAKARQRTWRQTERVLRVNCAAWLDRPMATITRQDAQTLLRGFIADGHPYKASMTMCWIKTLWRWASDEEIIPDDPMRRVKIEVEHRVRDRVYTDEEIAATWRAAEQLDPERGAFVKLLILLAPRKTALAAMQWTHLDNPAEPTLWTTPHELTKSKKKMAKKRVYLTPLPPLAQRMIRGLPRNGERVFPSLPVAAGEQTSFHGAKLLARLVERGAPSDLAYHAWRHTVATWLENEGASEWERGLVLNHAGSGVTAGYSHGFAGKLKLELLCRWSDHVERLVQPEGAALLL
ncbi:MAG: integrase arm-type DNA-binding domain-containing protein [Hyphomicrobiales bacterium]|nr:integrase arm-type DNA-binding domain-containing protein [Hyphomicrobiales bacterium]